jgi:MoaA/NifB/PqqE/SkfB family radical SAM enzyme
VKGRTFNSVRRRTHQGLNTLVRRLGGGRLSSYVRPVCPLILVTERCNAKCVHCNIWQNRGKEDSPSFEEWKTLVSDLRSWLGPIQIVFTGGEALLKPFTIELVAYASSLGFFVEILTHGYWDDQSKIERLMLARPGMVTISVDGIGELHNRIRGREKFWEKTSTTIETVKRVRKAQRLKTVIRLKNVIMSHNLDGVCDVARFARQPGMEVFFQPIEQNYNTAEDPTWWEHTENWPRDTDKAVRVVEQLTQMKRQGFPIANSYEQLEVMIPYFRNPAALRVSTQSHRAHERKAICTALTMLQIQANGDVTTCPSQMPVGNIKTTPVREIWDNRPRWWESGCCLERRLSQEERTAVSSPISVDQF